MSELRKLSNFLVNLTWEQVPDHVQQAVNKTVMDTIGVGIGACQNPQILDILKTYRKLDHDHESVKIWGQNEKASLFTAMYINAMEGHTLEMDDVHTRSKVHIGTVVIPAAWSVAKYCHNTGKEFLLAVLCGYEAAARIGMALGVSSHRNLGWHATATAGSMGATAAVAKLLELDEDKMVYALGMAGQIAGGTWAFLGDGASCKVLNPATAAVNGARCAFNALAGMTGPEHVLTTPDGGMLAAMSQKYDVSQVCKDLATAWEILQVDNKPYPCCRSTHCTIDAALDLREKYQIKPEDIDHIIVRTYQIGYKQCGVSKASLEPTIAVEAKFSTPFTVATALLRGKVALSDFTPEMINEESVQDLLKKVTVVPDQEFTDRYPNHWGCKEEIYLKNGDIRTYEVADATGSVENPLTDSQLSKKIMHILETVKTPEETSEIIRALSQIATQKELLDV